MEKDRTRFTHRMEIVIDHADRKVERTVTLNGNVIYREWFGSQTEWLYAGGNPVLDLLESRFIYFRSSDRMERGSRWKDPHPADKGLRRLIAGFMDYQIRLVNWLFKRRLKR